VNVRDERGRTPLCWAAEHGREAVVKLLLARSDAVADSKGKEGRTPLSWAAEHGSEAIVKLLLARPDLVADSKDRYGHTPLYFATRGGNEAVKELLQARSDAVANSKVNNRQTTPTWRPAPSGWMPASEYGPAVPIPDGNIW